MPTYQYQCEKCGEVFEVRRHIAKKATSPACPRCGAKQVHQVLGAFYAKTIKKS